MNHVWGLFRHDRYSLGHSLQRNLWTRYLMWLCLWALSQVPIARASGARSHAAPLPIKSETLRFPLTTKGRHIVDQQGFKVKLKSVNWYGAHLAGEVPGGLDLQTLDHVTSLIKEWGFNSVRLPFSNQMLHRSTHVAPESVAANPQLIGKTPLEVFDAVIEALGRAGLMVVLNNHSTSSEWCCGFDFNGLWFTGGGPYPQSVSAWEGDWLMLAARYRHDPWVVAADLRNEIRTGRTGKTVLPSIPSWGSGNEADWHQASQNLAEKLLASGVTWLFVVEGINWQGLIPAVGSGSRPQLQPVREMPIQLTSIGRLVYGAHTYGYTGPNHTGDDRTSPGQIRYQDMDRQTLFDTLDKEFGFVLDTNKFYSAPVWLSEFGVSRDESFFVWPRNSEAPSSVHFASPVERKWFAHITEYIRTRDLDFAYWPLNPDGYGLVSHDWATISDDDWRAEHLTSILAPPSVPEVVGEPQFHWTFFDLKRGDFRGDLGQAPPMLPTEKWDGDWLVGAVKGHCRANQRLIGLSQDVKGLCLGEPLGSERPLTPDTVVVAVAESYGHGHVAGDWASGRTKYECPLGFMVTGLTKHWWGLSGIRCQRFSGRAAPHCQTLWFDRQDSQLSDVGGDFAAQSYKGQCHKGGYVVGVAQKDGTPAALLCCGT